MITDEDPLRGLLFYWDLGFSHTLHVLTCQRDRDSAPRAPVFLSETWQACIALRSMHAGAPTKQGQGPGRSGINRCQAWSEGSRAQTAGTAVTTPQRLARGGSLPPGSASAASSCAPHSPGGPGRRIPQRRPLNLAGRWLGAAGRSMPEA